MGYASGSHGKGFYKAEAQAEKIKTDRREREKHAQGQKLTWKKKKTGMKGRLAKQNQPIPFDNHNLKG